MSGRKTKAHVCGWTSQVFTGHTVREQAVWKAACKGDQAQGPGLGACRNKSAEKLAPRLWRVRPDTHGVRRDSEISTAGV